MEKAKVLARGLIHSCVYKELKTVKNILEQNELFKNTKN